MTDLQGAVGVVQLVASSTVSSPSASAGRSSIVEQLAGVRWLALPGAPETDTHAWQAFVTYVDPDRAPRSRNQIMEELQERGIATRPGTHAVHMLGYYRDRFGYAPDDFPGARDCDANTMAIPASQPHVA